MPSLAAPLKTLPTPPQSFFLGHSTAFAKDALGFLTDCARQYGPVVPLRLGISTACLLTHPEAIEQVLKEREIFVKNTPGWRAIKTLVGNGLLTSQGDFWARQRRLSQPLFHHHRIAAYGDVMVAYTRHLMNTWQPGETRDLHQDMLQLTLAIVTKTLFDLDLGGPEAATVSETLDFAMEWFVRQQKRGFVVPYHWPLPLNRQYEAALHKMDQVIYDLIRQRRQHPGDQGDLLSMLLQVRDEEDGTQMSDLQVRDELVTLMLAGHETTANTLAWVGMLLAQQPTVEARLLAEWGQVLGGRSPTVADIPQLTYTQQVIKETLRLYPPVAVMARSANQDYDLEGVRIPAGCVTLFSQWVMHRSDRYFEEPAQFNPDRWTPEFEKTLPKGAYFPFGEGPRICIGKGFAQMEAALILATLGQEYHLSLVPDQAIALFPSITLRPKDGIQVQVQRR